MDHHGRITVISGGTGSIVSHTVCDLFLTNLSLSDLVVISLSNCNKGDYKLRQTCSESVPGNNRCHHDGTVGKTGVRSPGGACLATTSDN